MTTWELLKELRRGTEGMMDEVEWLKSDNPQRMLLHLLNIQDQRQATHIGPGGGHWGVIFSSEKGFSPALLNSLLRSQMLRLRVLLSSDPRGEVPSA